MRRQLTTAWFALLLATGCEGEPTQTPNVAESPKVRAVVDPDLAEPDPDESPPTGDEAVVPATADEKACAKVLRQAKEKSSIFEYYEGYDGREDFDGDGTLDCMFQDYSSIHLYALGSEGTGRYLGSVRADEMYGAGCTGRDRDKDGYCIVWSAQHMIHGERQTEYYSWDGSAYAFTGEYELSERPPKFRN